MKTFSFSLALFFFSLAPPPLLQADILQSISDCSAIKNNAERLACYDMIATSSATQPDTHVLEKKIAQNEPKPEISYLSKLWGLDSETRRDKYSLVPHRPSYILPVSLNNKPNETPNIDGSSEMDVKDNEVKFQLSLKVKLWEDILGNDMDLWFGYTQQSFWQLYNTAESSPFRETNYEPELLVNFRTDYDILGMKCRMINVGFNHQSNGRSEPYSRSWNRIVANVGLEKDNFTLLLKTWYRLPESKTDDDNPDTDDYLGYGEIWGYYTTGKQRFAVMLRNNLQSHENRGALQLDWSFPLIPRVSGYIQYFTGYGESLLDYNHSVNRIGIGFMLKDWN